MGKTLGVVVASIILILALTWLAADINEAPAGGAAAAAPAAAPAAPAAAAAPTAAPGTAAAPSSSAVAHANPATLGAPPAPAGSSKGQSACQPVSGGALHLEGCRLGEAVDIPGVVFDYKKTTLNAAAQASLGALAADLKAHKKMRIEVDGFTDSVASVEYNQGLALARARAAKAFLVSQGVKASRLTVRGVGKAGPVGDNATESGRAQNRRVGLTVLAPG